MERIAKRLDEKMPRYNWAGFYLIDPTDPNFLIVGPFAGSLRRMSEFDSPLDCAVWQLPANKWLS